MNLFTMSIICQPSTSSHYHLHLKVVRSAVFALKVKDSDSVSSIAHSERRPQIFIPKRK